MSTLLPSRIWVRLLVLFALVSIVVSCDDPEPFTDANILVIGDSVMAWNRGEDAAIADVIAAGTGFSVLDRSVSGARLSHDDQEEAEAGGDIRRQYRPGVWEWVVMDGGANDLGDECGCGLCDETLNEMVSANGRSGQYPDFARTVVADGSWVLVMGYYAPPTGADTEFTACTDEFTELNRRLQEMALATDDVYFASAASVIDPANLEHYDADRVHPSTEGSRLIGEMLSIVLTANTMD